MHFFSRKSAYVWISFKVQVTIKTPLFSKVFVFMPTYGPPGGRLLVAMQTVVFSNGNITVYFLRANHYSVHSSGILM